MLYTWCPLIHQVISIAARPKNAQSCVQNVEESSNAKPSSSASLFSVVSLGCDDAREAGMQGGEGVGRMEGREREGWEGNGEKEVKK